MTTGLLKDRDVDAGGTPIRRPSLRSLLRRLKAFALPVGADPWPARLECLEEVCAVLVDARAIVERSWTKDRWFARPGSRGSRAVKVAHAAPPIVTDITGACLVGAVVHAARQRTGTADVLQAAPALDVLWDAWQESRGLGGPGVAGRGAPREVRAARVRDLTRWNDHPDRSREEVLGLLDRAVGRAIMEAMEPAPRSAVRAG